MSLEELNNLILAKPFQPFRLYTTDGEDFGVRHPAALRVAGSTAVVFTRKDEVPSPFLYDRFHLVSLLHIVRVELLEPATHNTNGG